MFWARAERSSAHMHENRHCSGGGARREAELRYDSFPSILDAPRFPLRTIKYNKMLGFRAPPTGPARWRAGRSLSGESGGNYSTLPGKDWAPLPVKRSRSTTYVKPSTLKFGWQ